MNSSMALWYKPRDNAHPRRRPAKAEVHLNLWRQTAADTDDSNFLDVGLLLEDTGNIENFFLFVPIALHALDIEDLSVRLRKGNLLSAVFNEIITITDENEEGTYFTSDRNGGQLTIHSVSIGTDVDLEPVEMDQGESGTILRFRSKIVKRLRPDSRNYIRIRFLLDRAAAREFSLNTRGWGHALVSTILSEEFTELRFNEMRNMPPGVLARIDRGNTFELNGAHCFLIRDRSFELVAEHAPMHKMRRMEAKLWSGYLPEKLVKTDLSKMMIYHWKKISEGDIDSFITLARFRRQRDTLLWYVPGVIALGALGSALAAIFAEWRPYGGKLGNLRAAGLLLLFLAAFAMLPTILSIIRRGWSFGRRRWNRWKGQRRANS